MNITIEWLMTQPFEIVGSGREFRLNCPNCEDTTKHLYVNADRSLWYCFKCGKGGKVHYQKQEQNLELFEHKAREFVGTENVKVQKKVYNEITKVKSLPLHRALPHIEIAEDCESSEEYIARRYLWKRGITQDEIVNYGISLSLEKTGPYRNSIIFPVYNPDGPLLSSIDYFVCRKYDNSKPKYVNAPWPKDGTLFIANNTYTTPTLTTVIVEGIFDALAIARLGYTGIALLGKTATSQQLNRLGNTRAHFIIYLDDDALSHAIQLKMQLNTLGKKASLIRQEKDAADLYLEDPKYLRGVIENARKH